MDDDIDMTSTQAVIFVILNFCMAVILLVAVNCSIGVPCGVPMKFWLIIFSMILAIGSLVSVFGMDIDRKPRLIRRVHQWCKLAQYLTSVGWLFYGNFLAFIDGDTCPRELPWLSMTMMVTLLFGWIQLVMFIILAGGCLIWAVAKCFGIETSFTPQTLWRDQ